MTNIEILTGVTSPSAEIMIMANTLIDIKAQFGIGLDYIYITQAEALINTLTEQPCTEMHFERIDLVIECGGILKSLWLDRNYFGGNVKECNEKINLAIDTLLYLLNDTRALRRAIKASKVFEV